MADLTRRTFTPKYVPQSDEYNSSVNSLKENLDSALTELNNVENTLGLDPENAHDILTYNVIIGNNEIKDEITNLVSDLEFYTGEVAEAAKNFDAADEEEFNRAEDERIANLRAQQEAATNSGETEEPS